MGELVAESWVQFVVTMSDVSDPNQLERAELLRALAIWKALMSREQMFASLDSAFDRFDTSRTGTLSQVELRALLTELNEGIPVSPAETSWVLESVDPSELKQAAAGKSELQRDELRSAVATWYFHVAVPAIEPRKGVKSMIPWAYSFVTGCGCAVLVAGVSMNWSEAKTQAWLSSTGLSLLWKLFVFDLMKALFCGQVREGERVRLHRLVAEAGPWMAVAPFIVSSSAPLSKWLTAVLR
eukprot:SAG22_NODE_681_length_7933_cov_27.729257_5_plen_240_part_00